MQINLKKPEFTLAETSKLSGVTEMNIRNWLKRGLEGYIGEQEPKSRRWLFSGWDIYRLKIIYGLVAIGLTPEVANSHASHAIEFSQNFGLGDPDNYIYGDPHNESGILEITPPDKYDVEHKAAPILTIPYGRIFNQLIGAIYAELKFISYMDFGVLSPEEVLFVREQMQKRTRWKDETDEH